MVCVSSLFHAVYYTVLVRDQNKSNSPIYLFLDLTIAFVSSFILSVPCIYQFLPVSWWYSEINVNSYKIYLRVLGIIGHPWCVFLVSFMLSIVQS
jgi:hypothetical protein